MEAMGGWSPARRGYLNYDWNGSHPTPMLARVSFLWSRSSSRRIKRRNCA